MDMGKHAHSDQQESALPSSAASANVLGTAQGETSEKGFYDPFRLTHPFNTSSSLAPLPPFSTESRAFPSSSPLMSRDESPSDPPGLRERTSPTTGMHVWNSPERHSASSPLRSQPSIQTNPPFFGSSALAGQPHNQSHVQEPQMTPGNPDPSVSLTQQAPQSLFPVSSLPTQFASGPLYTHRNSLTGQYTPSSHSSPPFQNPPSQPYMYPGYHPHPADSGQYPPNVPGYFTIPQQHPQAYLPQRLAMEGGNPSYQHAPRASIPGHQPATVNHGSPYTRPWEGRQYPPLLYSSTSPFGFAQQRQPGMYQWYYLPGLSALPFNKGVPVQFQQYPVQYPQPPSSLNLDTIGGQPRDRPPSPRPKHASSSGDSSTAQNPAPTSTKPREHSAPSSSATDPHDRSNKSPTAFHVHERPHVRRHYHPNPPPNRSEWVMWVGNVPSDAGHDELWRFLKQPASPNLEKVEDDGVISIFLISRSSCAFVNYQSEEHLNRAISRFNGRQLRPHDRRCPRLVCRARRKEDDLRAGVGAQRGVGVHIQRVKKLQKRSDESADSSTKRQRSDPYPAWSSESERLPLASSTPSDEDTAKSHLGHFESPKAATRSSSSYASTNSSFLSRHFPRRFFILKSLTQYDLDLSVERGVWATQKHNEAILDQAFRTSKEVILIFGVNKSGEFYGYARMASPILRSDYSISWASRVDSSPGSSSHSSSRVQARTTPGESDNSSLSSPSMFYTSPSENRRVEDFSLQVVPSSEEGSVASGSPVHLGIDSSKERHALDRQLQVELVADVPLRPSLSSSNNGWPVTSSVSAEADPDSARPIELGRHPAVRPPARNKGGGADASGNPGMALQTVTEEVRTGSTEEVFPLQARAGRSTENHDQSEDRSRESQVAGWGETFKVDWLSTERVPFHRTRHLRNPWNYDREIKVSRDGTELEPGVGQALVDNWLTLANELAEGESGRNPRSGKRGAKSAATLAASGE